MTQPGRRVAPGMSAAGSTPREAYGDFDCVVGDGFGALLVLLAEEASAELRGHQEARDQARDDSHQEESLVPPVDRSGNLLVELGEAEKLEVERTEDGEDVEGELREGHLEVEVEGSIDLRECEHQLCHLLQLVEEDEDRASKGLAY